MNASHTTSGETSFRVRYLPVFLTTSIATTVIIIVTEAGESSAANLAIAAGGALAALAVLCLLAMLVFKVRVDATQIRGQDSIGFPRQMKWQSIESVRLFNCPGIPFYRLINSEGHRELWLPGFLHHAPEFQTLVESVAGADHPLAEFLQDRSPTVPGTDPSHSTRRGM